MLTGLRLGDINIHHVEEQRQIYIIHRSQYTTNINNIISEYVNRCSDHGCGNSWSSDGWILYI